MHPSRIRVFFIVGTTLESHDFAIPNRTWLSVNMLKYGRSTRTLNSPKLIENKLSVHPRGNSWLVHKKIQRFPIPYQKSACRNPFKIAFESPKRICVPPYLLPEFPLPTQYYSFRGWRKSHFAPAVNRQPWFPRGQTLPLHRCVLALGPF